MIINTEKPDMSALPMWALPAPGELYFDIETTGLSARTSFLYLVGFVYLNDNEVYLTQIFSELPSDEINVLNYFASFIKDYSTLIHFNGETFDIPYMSKKLQAAGIENTLDTMQSMDLYKDFRKLKKLLALTSLKQKAVEVYLNIPRLDQYDGNGLIDIYQRYVGLKKKDDLSLMLLHNYEDVRNMLAIREFLKEFEEVKSCKKLKAIEKHDSFMTLVYDCPTASGLDLSIKAKEPLTGRDIIIDANKGELTLILPVFCGTLKKYFANYKDYFYLPEEDKIIHKSVGTFVDPAYREKAKAENCFVPCRGRFVPGHKNSSLSFFQTELKAKQVYASEQEITASPEKACDLLSLIISSI